VTIRKLEERIEELQEQSEDIIAAALEKERARLEEMQSKHAVDHDRKNRRVQPFALRWADWERCPRMIPRTAPHGLESGWVNTGEIHPKKHVVCDGSCASAAD